MSRKSTYSLVCRSINQDDNTFECHEHETLLEIVFSGQYMRRWDAKNMLYERCTRIINMTITMQIMARNMYRIIIPNWCMILANYKEYDFQSSMITGLYQLSFEYQWDLIVPLLEFWGLILFAENGALS